MLRLVNGKIDILKKRIKIENKSYYFKTQKEVDAFLQVFTEDKFGKLEVESLDTSAETFLQDEECPSLTIAKSWLAAGKVIKPQTLGEKLADILSEITELTDEQKTSIIEKLDEVTPA